MRTHFLLLYLLSSMISFLYANEAIISMVAQAGVKLLASGVTYDSILQLIQQRVDLSNVDPALVKGMIIKYMPLIKKIVESGQAVNIVEELIERIGDKKRAQTQPSKKQVVPAKKQVVKKATTSQGVMTTASTDTTTTTTGNTYAFPALLIEPDMSNDPTANAIFLTALPQITGNLQYIAQIVRNQLYSRFPNDCPTKTKLTFKLGKQGTGGAGSSFARAVTSGTQGSIVFSAAFTRNFRGLNSLKTFQQTAYGTLVHEMTHIFQNYGNNGGSKAPQSLIEGIADYVQIASGNGDLYVAQNKYKLPGRSWDSGYIVTAMFLRWIDNSVKRNFVTDLNRMMANGYSVQYFQKLTGYSVGSLWNLYLKQFKN